jgi:hypothetical protein
VKRTGALLAALLVAGAVLAAIAHATTVLDRDDIATGLDIAKASSTHNRATDELVQSIDTYDPFAPADLVTKGRPPSSVCFEIWTKAVPGRAPADYEACATPDASGKSWRGSVARTRQKGPRLRVAGATVEQPSPTRLVLRFKPASIQRPAVYRWRAETTAFIAGCDGASGCQDYAPDRPDTAKTPVGKPRP